MAMHGCIQFKVALHGRRPWNCNDLFVFRNTERNVLPDPYQPIQAFNKSRVRVSLHLSLDIIWAVFNETLKLIHSNNRLGYDLEINPITTRRWSVIVFTNIETAPFLT
jgi:hypothetical protein